MAFSEVCIIANNKNLTSDFMDTRENAFNVGVDIICFTPITLDELTSRK